MSDKPYLSPTQLDMFTRCGEAYRRRYREGEVIPPGVALLKGSGFHDGAATNMRQKIESGVDLPAGDIVDAAVAAFEAGVHGGYVLDDAEAGRGAKVVLAEAKDSLVALAELHAAAQAPDYQPRLVEHKVRIVLPDAPRDLLGIIDLADDRGRVTDFKTTSRRKSQAEADASVQLTTYAAAYAVATGAAPSEVRLDVLAQGKKETARQVLVSQRTEADYAALANRLNVVNRALDADVFVPAAPGAWNCSPRWCGYWATCALVNSERRALAEHNGDA